MNLIVIDENNIFLLEKFIKNIGDSVNTFRYFQKRSLDCIKNHLITYIILDIDEPVAYGHLDQDNKKTWLGVCVKSIKRKQGLGSIMVEELVKFAKNNDVGVLNLTVDKENIRAIKLYKKFGFVEKKRNDNIIFMERN